MSPTFDLGVLSLIQAANGEKVSDVVIGAQQAIDAMQAEITRLRLENQRLKDQLQDAGILRKEKGER